MAAFSCLPLTAETVRKIDTAAFRDDPRISPAELRQLSLSYIDFDGQERSGVMICNAAAADDLLAIFAELFEAGYQIEKIRTADEYGGDDDLIMADNCSSCFNYRTVAGTQTLSLHALGLAVDINPRYNPYIVGGRIMPPNGAEYADRRRKFPHKIDRRDLCYRLFRSHGWKWGGSWRSSKDYQHFYKEL